jgi:hypothetical protein
MSLGQFVAIATLGQFSIHTPRLLGHHIMRRLCSRGLDSKWKRYWHSRRVIRRTLDSPHLSPRITDLSLLPPQLATTISRFCPSPSPPPPFHPPPTSTPLRHFHEHIARLFSCQGTSVPSSRRCNSDFPRAPHAHVMVVDRDGAEAVVVRGRSLEALKLRNAGNHTNPIQAPHSPNPSTAIRASPHGPTGPPTMTRTHPRWSSIATPPPSTPSPPLRSSHLTAS